MGPNPQYAGAVMSQGAAVHQQRTAPQQQAPHRPKIDPSQIPRPKLITSPCQEGGSMITFYPQLAISSSEGRGERVQMPPLPDTRYMVQDDGNTSPDMMRATTYTFPLNRGVWHHTGDLPLAVMCTPLAVHSEDFVARPRVLPDGQQEPWRDMQRVPLVANQGPPPRCGTCHAYANPFFGRDGTCNLCGSRTKGLSDSLTGLPMQFGTVDYDVDGPYITRHRPVHPVQVYAIDLTCPDIQEYIPVLLELAEDMASHFERQPDSTMVPRMGVCFVSSAGIALHQHCNDAGRYTFVADITEDPFAPCPIEDWTFELGSKKGFDSWKEYVCDKLTSDITSLRNRVRGKSPYGLDGFEISCGGAALAFLSNALEESGGRGTLITWRRPNFGIGKLTHREERLSSTVRGQEDYTPYTPVQILSKFKSPQDQDAAVFYKKLGGLCAKNSVCLDVLYHTAPDTSHTFLDVATIGELCRQTCGQLMWISGPDWQKSMREELTRHLQTFKGVDAVFKLRCSSGLQIKSFFSNSGVVQDEGFVGTPELELASVSSTTTISAELEHRVGGISTGAPYVFLQSALLYSTASGKRRVRVSTLALKVSSVPKDVFRSADFPAISTFLLRKAALHLREIPSDGSKTDSPRPKAFEEVYNHCVKFLAAYRMDSVAVYEQLLLPDTLQLLPLFCMCLMKSPMLRPGVPTRIGGTDSVTIRPSSDTRAFFIWHASRSTPMTALMLVYPRIFYVDFLTSGMGDWQIAEVPEHIGFVRLPNPVAPSIEALEDDGIYLIDNGLRIFLYIGKDVDDELKQAARGRPLAEWNPAADSILWQLRAYSSINRGCESECRPTYASLTPVCQEEGHRGILEPAVLDCMVDDAAGAEDYVDFLIQLHRNVRAKVQSAS